MSIVAEDIRMGDVVRLRNGDEVEVDSITDRYHDRDGTHEGPFVTETKTFHHYHLSDVAEIARRNERLCRFCGGGVTSTNPEVDYCRMCHYSGRSQEELRAEQIAAIAKLTGADTVEVEHTGGGCFWLAVRFADEEDFYVLTDGEASLPDQPSGGWRYVGIHNDDEASPHYEGTPVRFLDQDIAADEGLSDGEAALVITRHRQGKRPYPRRGETRITASNGTWEKATVFRLGVPTALAKEVGPDAMFRVEVTPEGILYRWIEGEVSGRPEDSRPDWLGS